MVTNYYNASNNFSAPIRKEPKPFKPGNTEYESELVFESKKSNGNIAKNDIFKSGYPANIDRDTIFIICLIFLLLSSGCEDNILLIALAYLILF